MPIDPVKFASTHYSGPAGSRLAHVYQPAHAGTHAAVVLLHAGGFVEGGLESVAPLARSLAARLDADVIVPAYTLASERPFPAAVEDAYAALLWARDYARERHGDGAPLVVVGEEAGGNLAAAAAMIARDRGGPALAAQVLLRPMLDPSLSSLSMQRSAIEPARCTECYRAYLPNAADRLHPYAAPAAATRLAGLPPTLILTAAADPLRDEAETYGARLIAAGVTTQVSRLVALRANATDWSEPALAAIESFLTPRLAARARG